MANVDFGLKFWKNPQARLFIFAVAGFSLFLGIFIFSVMKNRAAKEDMLSKLPRASSLAERALLDASRGPKNAGYKTSAKIKSSPGPLVVKESRFDSVSEPPKSLMEVLQDMAGGGKNKKKPPAIFMKDGDLDKKIILPSFPVKPPRMGGGTLQTSDALPTAPVTYKLFRDSSTWSAFRDSHDIKHFSVNSSTKSGFKGLYGVKRFPPDFASQAAVILVSLSEFPSGIFQIVKIMKEKAKTVIQYRINPFSMSPTNPGASPHAYSAGVIDRPKLPIVLEQVP